MRVLLVTLSDLLPVALNSVLNPANEYCAIVVDTPEPARKIAAQLGYPENLLCQFHDIKEIFTDCYYDVVLGVTDNRIVLTLHDSLVDCGLPVNKSVYVFLPYNEHNDFLLEQALRYYGEHSSMFDIFATGISYVQAGLDTDCFDFKLFNVGKAGQDLYYGYKIAENIMNGGGYASHLSVSHRTFFITINRVPKIRGGCFNILSRLMTYIIFGYRRLNIAVCFAKNF